tara:strand:+ start:243 stop:1859 length:1617 start_codon:yes stop_codon:yes gene_type:complete
VFNKKVIQYDEPVYITVSKLFLDVDSPSKLFPHISEMFIDNDIQRPPCWGDDDRNEFIESLLMGLYPAPIVLADMKQITNRRSLSPADEKYFDNLCKKYAAGASKLKSMVDHTGDGTQRLYSVIDGQNRLLTIQSFLADEYVFTPSPEFGMKHQEVFGATGQKGVKFSGLTREMQVHFENIAIPLNIYTSLDLKNYRGLFGSINAGVPTTDEEKRNGYGTDICQSVRRKAVALENEGVVVESGWWKRLKAHGYIAGYARLFYSYFYETSVLTRRATDHKKVLKSFYKKEGNEEKFLNSFDNFWESYFMKMWRTHKKDGEFIKISNKDITEMFLLSCALYRNKLTINDPEYLLRDMFQETKNRFESIKMSEEDRRDYEIAKIDNDKQKQEEIGNPLEKDYATAYTRGNWIPNAVHFRRSVADEYIASKLEDGGKWLNDEGEPVVRHKRQRLSDSRRDYLIRNGRLKTDPDVTVVDRKRGDTEVDHRDPLARGGNNNLDNLIVTSRDKNRKKGSKSPEEWATYCDTEEPEGDEFLMEEGE